MNASNFSSPFIGLHSHEVKKAVLLIAQSRSLLPNAILVPSIFLFYGIGIYLSISREHIWTLPLSTIMLSVALLWAWYLSHDCAHLSVLKTKKANDFLGEILSLISGVSYSEFSAYRNDHFRHHSEKIDLVGLDIKKCFKRMGKVTRRALIFLESIYIPVFFFFIKYASIGEIVRHDAKAKKLRVLASLVVSWSFYITLFCISKFALIPFFFAICIRINVVRFVDAFQHSYNQIDPISRNTNTRDRDYEFANTFSVPVAKRFCWLNLIILNFGFHGAHYVAPICPWYLLPKLNNLILKNLHSDQSQSGAWREWGTSLTALTKNYHKYRIKRIFSKSEGNPYNAHGQFTFDHFTGAFTDKLLG